MDTSVMVGIVDSNARALCAACASLRLPEGVVDLGGTDVTRIKGALAVRTSDASRIVRRAVEQTLLEQERAVSVLEMLFADSEEEDRYISRIGRMLGIAYTTMLTACTSSDEEDDEMVEPDCLATPSPALAGGGATAPVSLVVGGPAQQVFGREDVSSLDARYVCNVLELTRSSAPTGAGDEEVAECRAAATLATLVVECASASCVRPPEGDDDLLVCVGNGRWERRRASDVARAAATRTAEVVYYALGEADDCTAVDPDSVLSTLAGRRFITLVNLIVNVDDLNGVVARLVERVRAAMCAHLPKASAVPP